MTMHKVYISIDDQNFFWVIIENGKVINRNATKEDLVKIVSKSLHYNKTNVCPICREKNKITDRSILYPKNASKEYNKKGEWTGKWTCKNCNSIFNKYLQYDDPPRHINEFCDRCNKPFKDSGHGQHYKEKIDGSPTGKEICHICYMRDQHKRSDDVANIIKAINKCKYRYNKTETCDRCGSSLLSCNSYPRRECDYNGNWTGKWDCYSCYSKFDPNSKSNIAKSLTHRRLGIQDPNSTNAKGDIGEELFEEWKGYTNLNKKSNSYTRTRRDFLDEKTGEYYQVRTAYFNPEYKRWNFNFADIIDSIIEGFEIKSVFMFCISEDGTKVEKGLEISSWEITRSVISVYNNTKNHWYNDFIIRGNELDKINAIWKKLMEEFCK